MPTPPPGSILWTDLTVQNADQLRDFYAQVVGWKPEPVKMGEYNDYNMKSQTTGEPVAGVCHARGVNADLPAQWLLYVEVEDLDASMQTCTRLGGRVVAGPKGMGGQGRYCVIQDPAGAFIALISSAKDLQ